MATMHTLLGDLHFKTVGMGQLPDFTRDAHSSVISDTNRIKYKYKNMKVTLTNGTPPRMTFTPSNSFDMNGTYLGYEADWTTVTKIDALRPIVASGSYSGCEFQVFNSGHSIYCAHVSRDGNELEKNVAWMAQYAMVHGWKLIQRIETRGVKGDADSVCIVAKLQGHNTIRTVRLRLSNMGLVVGSDTFIDRL